MFQTKNGRTSSKTFQLSLKLAQQKKISVKNYLDALKIDKKSKINYDSINLGTLKCSKYI